MREQYVCKFGGTSVATADQIRKVENIIRTDPARKYIVVSAPGKSEGRKYKVTDLLYNLYYKTHPTSKNGTKYQIINELDAREIFNEINGIYRSIQTGLGLNEEIVNSCMNELESMVNNPNITSHDIASRGENYNARIIAQYLDANFVDATELLYVTDRSPDANNGLTLSQINQRLHGINGVVVIPGFYANTNVNNTHPVIRTFARGGSDLTGSLIAAGIDADLYENWTDQNGIKCADPRLFPSEEREAIQTINQMSYKEARELTYMGFEIFNDESLGPVLERNIPIRIKNTNNPNASGTKISSEHDHSKLIRGIAGKQNFCSINIWKYLMNKEIGFGEKVLDVIAKNEVNYEHFPSGIDNISVVLEQNQQNGIEEKIINEIRQTLNPNDIELKKNISLIAVVGEEMIHRTGIASAITTCLASNNININIINQCPSESNIILGVKNEDYVKAIRTLYNGLIKNDGVNKWIDWIHQQSYEFFR